MPNVIYSITVTFNPDTSLLKRQVESLINQVDKILIIDNGSKNFLAIKAMLQDICLEIILISLKNNEGLAAAQNKGIAKAIELGADLFLLLDQDSVLDSGFIIGIKSSYEKLVSVGCKVGALGPVFYDPLTKVDYPPTNYIGPFIIRSIQKKYSPVTFLIASGCFFSKKVFLDVGPMNNELFVDYIDVDWSLRAKEKGYALFMTDAARMEHSIGDKRKNLLGRTISVHSPIRRYFLIRNSFFMLRQKYVPMGYKVRECVFNLLRGVVGIIYSNDRKSVIKYIIKGVKDGLNNKFGPLEK